MLDGGSASIVDDEGNAAWQAEVVSTSSEGQGRLEVDELPVPKTARLSYRLKIVSVSPEAYAEIGTHVSGLKLKVDDQTAGGSNPSASETVEPYTLDAWYRVTVSFTDIAGSTANETAMVEGKTYLSRPIALPAPPERVRVKCGIDYADVKVDAVVRVDDVTLDFCDE